MKIAVCIKRVPDMDVRFKIAASGKSVDESGLKFDISDFDGYAVEAALQIKEKANAGEVVVISLGPDIVQETLRKAMSMGADRAVQLKHDAPVYDGSAIAAALAAELKDGAYDLVMFGRMSIDTANQSVGVMTAELLGMPVMTALSKLDFDGTLLRTAAVMRHRCHISNRINADTERAKRTNRRFTSRTWALDFHVQVLDTLLNGSATCHF